MGTFYQVNVGPFATTAETDSACKALKSSGYDCLVVKN
jgi:cell division protein FtsN